MVFAIYVSWQMHIIHIIKVTYIICTLHENNLKAQRNVNFHKEQKTNETGESKTSGRISTSNFPVSFFTPFPQTWISQSFWPTSVLRKRWKRLLQPALRYSQQLCVLWPNYYTNTGVLGATTGHKQQMKKSSGVARLRQHTVKITINQWRNQGETNGLNSSRFVKPHRKFSINKQRFENALELTKWEGIEKFNSF